MFHSPSEAGVVTATDAIKPIAISDHRWSEQVGSDPTTAVHVVAPRAIRFVVTDDSNRGADLEDASGGLDRPPHRLGEPVRERPSDQYVVSGRMAAKLPDVASSLRR